MAVGVVVAVGLGLLTAVVLEPVLRRLPEPRDEPTKIPYADVGSPGFVITTGSLVTVASVVAWLTQPAETQPVWWVLSSLGVLLAAVDARTTWLPLPLTRCAWLLMALALVPVGLVDSWAVVGRSLGGAAVAGALYFVVWRVSRGGFGFGDVRFAPLLGAAAGAGSWTLLLWGLTLGSLLGGAQGLVQLARHRRDGFAYAPAMLAGVYLACLLLALTGSGGVGPP